MEEEVHKMVLDMDNIRIFADLEKLKIIFFTSPTKGLVYYENLLLPQEDKGQNEQGYKNLEKAFENSSKNQKKLVSETIEILKFLRHQTLTDEIAKDIVKDCCDKVRDEVAMIRVIADREKK